MTTYKIVSLLRVEFSTFAPCWDDVERVFHVAESSTQIEAQLILM